MTRRVGLRAGSGGRRTALGRAAAAALVLVVTSCAYYNGMYNANRYAKLADQSERAGRTGEAAERWRLAAMHAESVTVRHPTSRWASEAMLVRGRALVHLEAWNDAVSALQQAARAASSVEKRREAELYLGRANLAIRRLPEAMTALDSAAQTGQAARRDQARLYRARVWAAMGRPEEALADLQASRASEARYDRPEAALAVGDTTLAARYAEDLVRAPYREAVWLPLLDALGRAGDPGRAAALVDQLLRCRDLTPGARARLLLADGERRGARGDAATAGARYRAALAEAPDSAEARLASLRLAQQQLRAAADTAEFSRVRVLFEQLAASGGTVGLEAGETVRLLRRADALMAADESADAWWFLRGELLRDSIGARRIAALAFAEMAVRFPESPWTPKGLLAAVVANHPAADSLRALLRERYPDSPYSRIALGGPDTPGRFALLEDSLRTVLAVTASEGRQAPLEAPDGPQGPGLRRPTPTPAQRPAPSGRPNPEP